MRLHNQSGDFDGLEWGDGGRAEMTFFSWEVSGDLM